MRTLNFFATLFFLSSFLSEQMKLSYELQNQGGKNFLVINSGENETQPSKPVLRKKKPHRKLKHNKRRRLDLMEGIKKGIESAAYGGMVGYLPAVYEKSAHKELSMNWKRALKVLGIELKTIKQNIDELFEVKLAMKRGLNKARNIKNQVVFRLHSKIDPLIKAVE